MKPKYYSCFFLSLFACDQGKIEVNNEKAQDVDPKGNLLNVDSSIIDVVNNLCKGVKDINDKNDPLACGELTTKLGGEYASSFWSLKRCQGIVKQLCEQVPSYPSQIVYDVLYALVKNKRLDADGVRTIIQGIKEDNPKVFSSLKNSVEKKFKTCNRETDDYSARIIAESFVFILNKTIFIPGINTFTSTHLPPQGKVITVDDLTDIWQCVSFIKNNGFDKNSLKKLIALASSGDFNEAIKTIATSKSIFNGDGNETMEVFDKQNVKLNDAGLKALADCIANENKISTTENLKKIIPSLRNCTDLKPILNKCATAVKVDEDFLQNLRENCSENYWNLLNSIPKKKISNQTKTIENVIGSNSLGSYNKNTLKKLVNYLEKNVNRFIKPNKYDEFLKLIDKSVDLNDGESCNKLIKTLPEKQVNLNTLKKLVEYYKGNPEKFNKVLALIDLNNFDNTTYGNAIIGIFNDTHIQLDNGNLKKILQMISNEKKISRCQTAINFCCENIQTLNETNIQDVFQKVGDNKFDLNALCELWGQYKNMFEYILPRIPDRNLRTDHDGNDVIKKIITKKIKLNKNTTPKVLLMIDTNNKISSIEDVFPLCYDNKFDAEDINRILDKCADDFKFNLNCLELYDPEYRDQFNAILSAINEKNFDTKCSGNEVVEKIKKKCIDFDKGNLSKVLLLFKDSMEKITNVDSLYFVFQRSKNEIGVVDALKKQVGTLIGNQVFNLLEEYDKKDFILEFCPYILDKSINMFSGVQDCNKFIKAAYEFHKANRLGDLKQKFDYDTFQRTLRNNKISLKKIFEGENDYSALKKAFINNLGIASECFY